MGKVTVTIQGCNYNMVGEKSERQIKTIASYVDSEMEKIKEAAPHLGKYQIAILALLNLADVLFDCSEENEKLRAELDELKILLEKPDEETEQKIKELKASLDAKEEELSKAKAEVDRLNEIVSSQKNEIEDLNSVTNNNKSEIDTYKSEIDSLKNQVKELEEKTTVAEGLSAEWQNRSCELQLKIAQLEEKLKISTDNKNA